MTRWPGSPSRSCRERVLHLPAAAVLRAASERAAGKRADRRRRAHADVPVHRPAALPRPAVHGGLPRVHRVLELAAVAPGGNTHRALAADHRGADHLHHGGGAAEPAADGGRGDRRAARGPGRTSWRRSSSPRRLRAVASRDDFGTTDLVTNKEETMRRATGSTLAAALLLFSLPLFAQGKRLAGVDPRGVTISYWYQHSGVNGDAMQKMIADFNATNQWKITVKGEYAGPLRPDLQQDGPPPSPRGACPTSSWPTRTRPRSTRSTTPSWI